MIATVVSTSPTVSFQDFGRTGFRKLGIAPAGVLDRFSATQANLLLGNSPGATVIEIGPGGLGLNLLHPTWLALAGCGTSPALLANTACLVPAGTDLRIHGNEDGIWSYLAAPGGWSAAEFFGSRSYHARSSLGQAVRSGEALACTRPAEFPGLSSRAIPHRDRRDFRSPPALQLHPGPHVGHFSKSDLAKLTSTTWAVSPQSDRSGYRLTGGKLSSSGSLPSIPTLVGSIQVPPSGEPIVTLNDGPTVGGYPVVAVLEEDDLPWLVQRPPHSSISFAWHETAPPQL